MKTLTPKGRSRECDSSGSSSRTTQSSNAIGNSLHFITITDATPQKMSDTPPQPQPVVGLPGPGLSTPTSSAGQRHDAFSSYRLLYRGALSLPDSYLLLDGVVFSARLSNYRYGSALLQDSPSSSLSRELMYNPLALALESMRGRQSLRFKGTVCLRDVWTDETGDVYMDIHPYATLTRIYFENVLCLSRLVAPPHDVSGLKRTEVGVRVSLGDTDGPETTEIVIYGETSALLHPPPLQLVPTGTSSKEGGPPSLSMRVARITPAPRAPRPDDPTPRQPLARSSLGITLSDLGANKRIVPRSNGGLDRLQGKDRCKETAEDQVMRRAKEVMLHLPRSKGKDKDTSGDGVFKVPEVPVKARRKQGEVGTDVFGAVAPPQPRSAHGKNKGKGKASIADREDGENENGSTIEGPNKTMLKRLAVHYLAEAGIPRSHVEFKEIFGFVYRGASFSLRSQLKTLPICTQAAEVVVEAHVKMYVLTSDGSQGASGSQGKALPMPDTNAPMDVDEDDTGG